MSKLNLVNKYMVEKICIQINQNWTNISVILTSPVKYTPRAARPNDPSENIWVKYTEPL